MKNQLLWKLGLMIVYPALAVFLVVMVTFVLLMAWFLIPFGVMTRDGDRLSLKFPWAEK